VLGHLYGGIMVQFFAWPVLFWINLPLIALMLALTVWAFRGLPESRSRVPMDWIGVLWITLALTGLNLGLAAGDAGAAGADTGAGIFPVPLALALLAAFAFVIHELRTPHPLLDLRLYRNRNISASSVLNLIIGFCLMAGLVSVPLFINLAGAQDLGQGALVSGYLLGAFTIPLALAALPGGWLTGRIGYRLTTLLGLVVALAGFGLMTQWKSDMAAQAVVFFTTGTMPEGTGLLLMVAGLALAGIGLGLTIAPIGTAVINGAGESERGIAAAAVIILRLVGMSLSVSLLTTYGLRRTTEISTELLQGATLTDLARIVEAMLQTVTRVTSEMAWIAFAAAAAGLIPALLLRRRDHN
jgi:MFS family permease